MLWLLALLVTAAAGDDVDPDEARAQGPLEGVRAKPERLRPRFEWPDPLPTPPARKGVTGADPAVWLRTWVPVYSKRRGCRTFRFGACLGDWRTSIGGDFQAAITTIADFLADYIPAIETLRRIEQNMCIRFNFGLEGVEDTAGGGAFVVYRAVEKNLADAAPPNPLSKRDGFERAWLARGSRLTNSEKAYITLFPNGDYWETLGEHQIRDLLSMRDEDGIVTINALARAACGKVKWWWARRVQAEKHWE